MRKLTAALLFALLISTIIIPTAYANPFYAETQIELESHEDTLSLIAREVLEVQVKDYSLWFIVGAKSPTALLLETKPALDFQAAISREIKNTLLTVGFRHDYNKENTVYIQTAIPWK